MPSIPTNHVGRGRLSLELGSDRTNSTVSGSFYNPSVFRKASCACGGGCPSCQSGVGNLKISQPNDAAEIEADAIADRVMRMPIGKTNPVTSVSEPQIQRQPDGETPAAGEEPDPIGEGLATVAENLGENNPAFSELTEDLGNRFRALPAPLSVGEIFC